MKRLKKRFLALAASLLLAFNAVPVQAEEGTFTGETAAGGAYDTTVYTGYIPNVQYHQDMARDMLAYVNDFRTNGAAWEWNSDGTKTENITRPKLVYDYGLEEIAMQRAAEIAASFSHTRPDGTPCYTCLSSSGGMTYGENISAGLASVSWTFEFWKEEQMPYEGQGHRRNMLGDYQAIGIGCAEMDGQYYWVQEFGSSTGTAATPACLDSRGVDIGIAQTRIASGYFISADELSVTAGDTVEIPSAFAMASVEGSITGTYVLITGGIPYTSDNSAIASVEGNKVTGVSSGTCSLIAHLGSQTFAIRLNVVEKGTHPMYRLYNRSSGEHFYTASQAEKDSLVAAGWKDEGKGWDAPNASHTPVYRLYNENGGEHHYTTQAAERNNLILNGWSYEGVGWYSDDAKAAPLYRLYNPNAFSNNHHYTTNAAEKDMLIRLGWHDEGLGWYGC